ncbi:hypothetical protein AZI85_03080 [Bdellovibrio bacteriovorus]|uniref:Uncharacterized protein n=1 Tax=Bdellovibrio bacteriovorus TaxID=959 RepID=A0A150WK96_BDEBC|nr:hypothetical protein [Bdellovibrio bacteriovorus]KYG64419.1 hypothetical protein AZI85_03080 [Bdellovibrio bacteriovorus]
MKSLVLFLLAVPGIAQAAMPVLSYKNVECRYTENDKLVKEQSVALMTLVIEDSLGRFAQIQFGDDAKKIQYQILIEDDLKTKDSVVILQNLMVDKLESSSELSGKEVSWVRIAQGTHSVRCDLKP